jgi:hypothetical protein
MKKLILALTLAVASTSSLAWNGGGYYGKHGNRPVIINNYSGFHGGYRGGHYSGNGWGYAGAAIGGALIGAAVSGAFSPRYVAPPVIYSPPVPVQPYMPYSYRYQRVFIPGCNCYQTVLVPN